MARVRQCHYDGLGSVAALSHNNAIVEAYCYDAFGQVKINTAAGPDNNWLTPDGSPATASVYGNRFMFTGREYDAETGLYYYRARMYCPQLGRFLQPDPIGYADSMNLYQYCGNNPVNFIDPWGLAEQQGNQLTPEEINDALNNETINKGIDFYKTLRNIPIIKYLIPATPVTKSVDTGIQMKETIQVFGNAYELKKEAEEQTNTGDTEKMCEALENRPGLIKEGIKNALKLFNIFKNLMTTGLGNGGGPKVTPRDPQYNPQPYPDMKGPYRPQRQDGGTDTRNNDRPIR